MTDDEMKEILEDTLLKCVENSVRVLASFRPLLTQDYIDKLEKFIEENRPRA